MAEINKSLIQKTIRLFSPPDDQPICEADALEMIQNAVDLYSYLLELKLKYEKKTQA